MDFLGEEQLDYGDEENEGSQKLQFQGSGVAFPAFEEGDDYEQLDYGDEGNEGSQKLQSRWSGGVAIPTFQVEDLMEEVEEDDEEQIDYGDEENEGSQMLQSQWSGGEEEELMKELYKDDNEQLEYGDEENEGSQKLHSQGSGGVVIPGLAEEELTEEVKKDDKNCDGDEENEGSQKLHSESSAVVIPALAEEKLMKDVEEDDDEYDYLYGDVTIRDEAFVPALQQKSETPLGNLKHDSLGGGLNNGSILEDGNERSGDEENEGSQNSQSKSSALVIPALAEKELMKEVEGDDDDCDDLYNDVIIGGGGFLPALQQQSEPLVGNCGLPTHDGLNNGSILEDGELEVNTKPSFTSLNTEQKADGSLHVGSLKDSIDEKLDVFSQVGDRFLDNTPKNPVENMDFQGDSSVAIPQIADQNSKFQSQTSLLPSNSESFGIIIKTEPETGDDNGATILSVGDLQWWTTDAELEDFLSQYGMVKEIKFVEEKMTGRSKGSCQVEFYDHAAAAACKEGMHGHLFNGKPCFVEFSSSETVSLMVAASLNKNEVQTTHSDPQPDSRGVMNNQIGRGGRIVYLGGHNVEKNDVRRANWGQGCGQGFFNKGGFGGARRMRGRGFFGPRGRTGAGYGKGIAGRPIHPQSNTSSGFDPTTYMGHGGPYGIFSAQFAGMIPPFQAVNNAGLPGVASLANPAFYGRGLCGNGLGMKRERGRRSDGYSENERLVRSYRRYCNESEHGWSKYDSGQYTEESNTYRDRRQRDLEWDNEDDWDRRASSSRPRYRSRMQEEDHRYHTSDGDDGHLHCFPSE